MVLAELHEGQEHDCMTSIGKGCNCSCANPSCQKHMAKAQCNKTLGHLLSQVGRGRTVLARQTISYDATATARISLLGENAAPDNESVKVTGDISKLRVCDAIKGDLDGKGGLVMQHVIDCPVLDPGLELRHAKQVD